MPVFMIVTVGFAMLVTVAMRVIVPVVFCRERQYISLSDVMGSRLSSYRVQMPRL